MNRRSFITAVSSVAALAAVAPFASLASVPTEPELIDPKKKEQNELLLFKLLSTPQGREKLATALAPVINRRLDNRRKKRGLIRSFDDFPADMREYEYPASFIATPSIHLKKVYERNFDDLTAPFMDAMATIIALEQNRTRHGALARWNMDVRPEHVIVECCDDPSTLHVGFKMMQEYTILRKA